MILRLEYDFHGILKKIIGGAYGKSDCGHWWR